MKRNGRFDAFHDEFFEGTFHFRDTLRFNKTAIVKSPNRSGVPEVVLWMIFPASATSRRVEHNGCMAGRLEHFPNSYRDRAKHWNLLKKLFRSEPPFTMSQFVEQLDKAAPGLVDSKVFERITDSFALAQAFCWLHSLSRNFGNERHYRELSPKLQLHLRAADDFLNQYLAFYRQLLDFKELPPAQQEAKKAWLCGQFDQIFTQKTSYDDLNQQIQKTFAKKKQLLLVLKYPFLPLRNNAAELAVRQKVRKRDISLQTMSAKGTKTQDAFMTVVQTAVKLDVSAFEYIADRVSRRFNMTPLAELLAQAYKPVTLPL